MKEQITTNLPRSIFSRRLFEVLTFWILLVPLLSAQSSVQTNTANAQLDALTNEVSFEQNLGQYEPEFHYVGKDRQATYLFMTGEVRTVVRQADGGSPFAYSMKFVGANAGSKPIGIGRSQQKGKYNIIDGGNVISDVPQHNHLRYHNVWNHVHAHFGQSDEGLKYDFIVNPGGDPSSITFELEGVTNVRVTPEGELAFTTPFGELRKGRPYTYQYIDAGQVEVPSAYVVEGNRVSFSIGNYDVSKKLVIDPVALKWATVLGGSTSFFTRASHIDQQTGNLYLVGDEIETVLPNTTGLVQNPISIGNAFVLCMKADGSEILWKTSIRGRAGVGGRGINVGPDGDVYIYINTFETNSTQHTYDGISPQIPGPLLRMTSGTMSNQSSALFRLSPGGDAIKYFTYLMDATLLRQATNNSIVYWGHYDGGGQPILFDVEGRVVIPVSYAQTENSAGIIPQNVFSPKGNNVFGLDNPITRDFTNIITLDTDIPGEDGLIQSSYVDFRLAAADVDGDGNLYFAGPQGALITNQLSRLLVDYFHPPYFTHMTLDTGAIHNYIRTYSGSNPRYDNNNYALFKLSPIQDELLYASYIGYQINDYMDVVDDAWLTVSEEGDVYFAGTYYIYSNIDAYKRDVASHPAPKQTILQDWEDVYQCDGYCLSINLLEKRPAGNYQNPEWMVQYPAGGNYWPVYVAFDDVRDKLHVLSLQDPLVLTPGTKPFVTDGAFQTEPPITTRIYRDYGHYMQLNTAGDVSYATLTTPELGDIGTQNYSINPAGLQINENNGEAYLTLIQRNRELSHIAFVTPSYHDFSTGEQVEVFGGNLIPAANTRYKANIMVFHDANPGENILQDFPAGENTFCVGSLIAIGENALPLEGNRVEYKSGDGSLPEHNLPTLVVDGIAMDHPAPAGSVPSYQWQSSFRPAGESEFGPWINVSGGTRFTLAPQEALAAGTIRYRRLVTIGEFNLVSNEIEAVISGTLDMAITGPSTPVYFCNDVSTDLGVSINNPAGTISWQWYAGFNPIGDDVIFPSSGSGVTPGAFSAVVAAGNTLSGYLRLLVTDDASGCRQQFFVTIQELSDKIYSTSSVTLCPGTSSVVLGPRVANPDWDYRYTYVTDMSTLTGLRPEVNTPGDYRLEVSIAGQEAYCAAGATEVTVAGALGDYDTGLAIAGSFGFCETGDPAAIGPDNPPADGYTYSWTPSVGLSDDKVSNPIFNPAVAAATQGIRTINYLFQATRVADGCVYAQLVTVSDTTQAEAFVPENPIYGTSCAPGQIQLYTGNGKGRFHEWRAVATNFPGGLEALESSPDYGLGLPGQLVSTAGNPKLYFPSGSGYYIDFSYKISYAVIGQTACFDSTVIRANLVCGGSGGFICRPINGTDTDPLCSTEGTLLKAQAANWSSASWSVVSVDGVPVPAGTQPRGLFITNDQNQKVEALVLGTDNPTTVIAHLEDPDWGFPGAQVVTYRFTGVIEFNGEIITCTDDIDVFGAVTIDPFDVVDRLDACRVSGSGTLVPGVGVTLPYTISLADYETPALAGYQYAWRVLEGTFGSILNQNTLTPTLSPTKTTLYELSLIDSISGCRASDTLTFAVANLSSNAGADLTACPGAIVEVGGGSIDGVTYSWSPGTGLFFPDATSPDSTVAKPLLVMPEAAAGTTLTLTVLDTITGCSATDEIILTSSTDVPPTPAGGNVTVCSGVSVEIGPATYSRKDVTFLWESSSGSDITWLSATDSRMVVVTLPAGFYGSVSYTVKAVSEGCGVSEPATYTITVPDPGIIMGSEPTVTTCLAPFTLLESNTITLPSGFTGEWFPKTGLFSDESGAVAYAAGANLNVYVAAPSNPVTYSLRVRHTTSGCAIIYKKEALPPADATPINAGGTLTYCNGYEPLEIGTAFVPGSQYVWAAVGYDANPKGSATTVPDATLETEMLSFLSDAMVNKPNFSQVENVTGAYRYRLSVTDAAGCTISDEVLIRVPEFEVISLPSSVVQCSGIPTQLISGNTPEGFGYQWSVKSPSPSQGTISDVNAADAFFSPEVQTIYELFYFDPTSGCESTQQVTVSIAPPLVLPSVAPLVYCEPTSGVDLTAAVSDYQSLNVRKWYRSLYPGVEAAEPSGIAVDATESYYLESINEFGCTDTTEVQVLLEQTSTPEINDLFTLSLLANTVNLETITAAQPSISGARLVWHTNPTYAEAEELESLTVSAGKYYLSEVSANGCVSSSAELTVYKRPYINALSTDLICAGSIATPITASPAAGLEEVIYLWQKSTTDPTVGATWVDIPDSDTLTLYPGVLNETTWFRIQVSEDGLTFTDLAGSNIIKIEVDTNDPPSVPQNTASEPSTSPELCDGVAVSGLFHTTTGATGIGAVTGLPDGVTASWKFDTIRIQGTPTESGTFSYNIQLTGGCGDVSATGSILVYPAFVSGSIAAEGETICYGGTPVEIVSDTLGSGGDGTISYSWRSSADGFMEAIDGASEASYTPPAGLTEATTYKRYVNDAVCDTIPVASEGSWTVTVYDEFKVGNIVAGIDTVCTGSTASIIDNEVAASGGDGNLAYTWRSSTDGYTADIAGADGSSYGPPTDVAGTQTYRRYVVDGTCNTMPTPSTGEFTLTVLASFNAGSIDSVGETICYLGEPSTISNGIAASGGDGNFTYSWRSSSDGFMEAIAGATEASYTPPAGLTETTTYRRYVNDGTCGTTAVVSAGSWTVTVKPSPVLSGPMDMNKVTSEDGTGDCMVSVSWTHPVETAGACEPLALKMTISDGTTDAFMLDEEGEPVLPGEQISRSFEPGTYEISYVLTDGGDNTATHRFELTVVDDESPILNCSTSIEVEFDGQQTLTLAMSDLGTVSDNCGMVSTTLTPSTVSVEQIGQTIPIVVMAEDESGNVSGCMTNVDLGGLPAGWSKNHAEPGNCEAETSYDPETGVWTGSAINCRYSAPFTADAFMFAQYQLCGDGSITAQVSSLVGALPYAGIAMRETGDLGTKKVQMMVNRISNTLRREVRFTTGGQAYPMHFSSPCERTWLRIVRTGNIFRGYTSQDGVTWWYVMNVHVPMNSCIEMGLVLTNMQPNVLDTANFSNVTVTGGSQGPSLWNAGMEESLESEEGIVDFNIYPNPVSGELQIDLSAFAGKSVRLSLYNMQGQAVMVQQLPEISDYLHKIDMSKLPVGVYSLRLQTAGSPELSRRVVVQRQ